MTHQGALWHVRAGWRSARVEAIAPSAGRRPCDLTAQQTRYVNNHHLSRATGGHVRNCASRGRSGTCGPRESGNQNASTRTVGCDAPMSWRRDRWQASRVSDVSPAYVRRPNRERCGVAVAARLWRLCYRDVLHKRSLIAMQTQDSNMSGTVAQTPGSCVLGDMRDRFRRLA
jgi:hypothetical protein